MNLKLHLLARIMLAALICLLLSATYVLYRADREATDKTQTMLDAMTKQLELQLLRIDSGLERADQFPDLALWKETRAVSGVCLRFTPVNSGTTRGICRGLEWSEAHWPVLFESVYRLFFKPGLEMSNTIRFKHKDQGVLGITPSVEAELSHAWESVSGLLTLSTITVVAVCFWVYLSISRALRPAQMIVAGLGEMQQGDLSLRLPDFELKEWQLTSVAINELAITQQQLLSEKQQLTAKLISLQDEERRYLARELHDELGQCLAAINALAASVTQTAEQECPAIAEEAKSITRINGHMMNTIRTLLVKLRPADIDELGFELSLKSLMTEWNTQAASKTFYSFVINGNCQQLPEPLASTLLRIIQEGLTNISKHSTAKLASIMLDISDKAVILNIDDDGDIDTLPSINNNGLGLLGIRERVGALDGKLSLEKNHSGGFSLQAILPVKGVTV